MVKLSMLKQLVKEVCKKKKMKYQDETGEMVVDDEIPKWILSHYHSLNNKKKKELKLKLEKRDKELGIF